MKRLIILLLITCILFSCEKDITLDLHRAEDALCVNSILEAGSKSITVYVSRVQSVNNPENIKFIDHADIEIQKDDVLLTGVTYEGNGKYILNHSPEEGSEYKLKVHADGYKTVSAKTRVPLKSMAEVSFERDTIYDPSWAKGYYLQVRLLVHLNDQPSKDFYWFIKGTMHNVGEVPYGSFGISYHTDILLFDDFNRYYNQTNNFPFTNYEYIGALRLDDENFQNKKLSFSLSTGKQPTLFIINADQHFDRYYKSSIKQFLLYEYDQLPVFEPVKIYTNVENGYGIFGSVSILKFYFNENL
jgi:hypothetical protein